MEHPLRDGWFYDEMPELPLEMRGAAIERIFGNEIPMLSVRISRSDEWEPPTPPEVVYIDRKEPVRNPRLPPRVQKKLIARRKGKMSRRARRMSRRH